MQCDLCPYKKRRRNTDGDTQEENGRVMDRSRDWGDASTSQGAPGLASKPQKLEEAKDPLQVSEGTCPHQHLNSDSYPPNL